MNSYRLLRPWLGSLRQRGGLALCGFALALLTALSGVALLGVSGWFITAAAVVLVAFDIFIPGAAIRAFALTRTVARYFERVVNHDLILRIQQAWRVRLFTGLFSRSLQQIEQFKLAHVLQRLTQDLNTLDDLYIRILTPVLLVSFVSLGLGWALYLLAPALGGLVWILAAILLAVHGWVIAPHFLQRAQAELKLSEDLRHHSLAFMHSKAELHAWRALPQAARKLTVVSTRLTRQQRRLRRYLWLLQHSVELVAMSAVVTAFVLALNGAMRGDFSVPVAVLVGLAVLAMQEYWATLPQATLLWGKVLGAAERLEPMVNASVSAPRTSLNSSPISSASTSSALARSTSQERASVASARTDGASASGTSAAKHTPTKPIANGPERAMAEAPSIKFEQVEFAHRPLPAALSLALPAGRLSWLEGPSGSGKTSVILALSGLVKVSQGSLEVWCGPYLTQLESIKRVTLSQDNAILAQSVAANLRMARNEWTDDELWAALESVEMADTITALPQQLDTWLGEGGVSLSGGQQRRLALARTLLHAQGAQLVLLDEPFNGVGAVQAERIWRRTSLLLTGKTVVIVSHQPLPPDTVQRRIQLW